jgi:pilus assembly protein CpaF
MDLPSLIIRQYIVGAVDFIIQIGRLPDGQRKMLAIAELEEQADGKVRMKDIFRFIQTGVTPEGKVQGFFSATGVLPGCLDRLKAYGVAVDLSIFRPHPEVKRP